MTHANDNRTPADHRAFLASNPKNTNRPHKPSSRQQQARLLADDCPHMAMALNDWAALQALPVVTVANDNWSDAEDSDEDSASAEWNFDNLMTTQSARLTVKLEAEGKPWRPGEERFDTPRRNNRSKAPPPAGSYRYNGMDLPALPDAEGESIRKIDASNVRRRLGHVCCRLLDLACGDATTKEIAAAVKQPMSPRIETYLDWSIIRWMRDPAFSEYAKAA